MAVHLAASDVVEAGTRLWTWLARALNAARLHREWPVAERQADGSIVVGLADIVARVPSGYVLVDHKTLPGSMTTGPGQLSQFSGQLAGYASAIRAATSTPVVSSWIHLALLGAVVEVTMQAPQVGQIVTPARPVNPRARSAIP